MNYDTEKNSHLTVLKGNVDSSTPFFKHYLHILLSLS